jgi:hypothetical protein
LEQILPRIAGAKEFFPCAPSAHTNPQFLIPRYEAVGNGQGNLNDPRAAYAVFAMPPQGAGEGRRPGLAQVGTLLFVSTLFG